MTQLHFCSEEIDGSTKVSRLEVLTYWHAQIYNGVDIEFRLKEFPMKSMLYEIDRIKLKKEVYHKFTQSMWLSCHHQNANLLLILLLMVL